MHASEAEHTVREVERVRRDTRRTLHPVWFANVVTGVFFLGATLVAAIADSATLPNLYWAIGVPAGLALIVRHEVLRERALGAEARLADPSLAILFALIAGVVVVNRLTDGSFGEVAWLYPVAAGRLGFAAHSRDAPLGAAAVALLLLAAGLVERASERA